MDENLHNIDNLFRSGMDDYAETPPAGVWNEIDKQLDKHNIAHIKHKYTLLKSTAVAVLLLFFGVSLYALLVWQNGTGLFSARPDASTKTKQGQQAITRRSTDRITTPPALPATGAAGLHQQPAGAENENGLQQKVASVNPKATAASPQPVTGKIASGRPVVEHANTNINRRSTDFIPDHITSLQAKPGEIPGTVPGAEQERQQGNIAGGLRSILVPLTAVPVPQRLQGEYQIIMPAFPEAAPGIIMPYKIGAAHIRLQRPQRKVLSLTFFATPGLTFNRLKSNRFDNREDNKNVIRQGERTDVSFMAGIAAGYSITPRLMVETGATLTKTVLNIAPKHIFARPDRHGNIQFRYNCSSGYYDIAPKPGSLPVIGDSIAVSGASNSLHYISVPLALKYAFVTGKLRILPMAGAAVNVLVKEKIETAVTSGVSAVPRMQNRINGLKRTYYSAIAGAEMGWNLNKLLALSIAPVGRFAITAINKDAPVKTYPAYLGITAGITLKL